MLVGSAVPMGQLQVTEHARFGSAGQFTEHALLNRTFMSCLRMKASSRICATLNLTLKTNHAAR